MMTVRELIELLQTLDPDDVVILSKDAEGNQKSPLEEHSLAVYVPETTWYGDTYPRSLDADDLAAGFTVDDDLYHGDDGVNAVVLWPVN